MLLLQELQTYIHCYHSALSNAPVVKINSWGSLVIISDTKLFLTLATAHGRRKSYARQIRRKYGLTGLLQTSPV